MKLAMWQPIPCGLMDDPRALRAYVPRQRQRAREKFLAWGYVAVGEWHEQVSDAQAIYSAQRECVLLIENYEAVPLPGLRGWWRRKTKGRHVR